MPQDASAKRAVVNAVEIEEAVSALADKPFDATEFPWEFLAAFDNPETTIKRLRKGETNKSDLGGVLQTSNIHLKVCAPGEVLTTLHQLRESPATRKAKAKFILATDGDELQAENLLSGEPLVANYAEFADRFDFFLPLAGIASVEFIPENEIDIRATRRLNRLYVELRKSNPTWNKRAADMNHFMARLIFCFFAEDTDIFGKPALFTGTVEQMSTGENAHEIIEEIFRALNTKEREKRARWARDFPYVNGGLFGGSVEVPKFSKTARSYLLNIGKLDWKRINPDIFGSMIQAVTDDEERGSLGMHYTSVPNILKVLNPLFLDDLRKQLKEAGDSKVRLLNLRKRLAKIRVFDPACGSGNFLVIAYKQMREIEAEVNKLRDESQRKSDIPLTNFRGIELREFPAEIARLALIIAEFQCDELYIGQKEALAKVLPLAKENWITCGNALRLDWLEICPPERREATDDPDRAQWETYICGNPPYLGSKFQNAEQKKDVAEAFGTRTKKSKTLDYVAGWFMKAADYGANTSTTTAFVATNSICQGQQVPILWPVLSKAGQRISFAHTSFKWANLAKHNAGVTVVIVGMSRTPPASRRLFSTGDDGALTVKEVANINAYLVPGNDVALEPSSTSKGELATMQFGNHPYYGGPLIFSSEEARRLSREVPAASGFIRPLYGAKEFISGAPRACVWVADDQASIASKIPALKAKFDASEVARKKATQDVTAQKLAKTPWRFRDQTTAKYQIIVVPRVSSERRPFLPVGVLSSDAIVQDQVLAMYDAPLWNMAFVASRIHLVWIATVCGKMKTDFRYSNTLGWNTFPVPKLTENNKADLTRAAERILLAREAYFPASIADLYDPDVMPQSLRAAHEHNDELVERIYVGRRFKNDTERLEKLFEMYSRFAHS